MPMIIYCETIYDNLLQMGLSRIERDKNIIRVLPELGVRG